MWIVSQKEFGTLVNLSEVKYIYKEKEVISNGYWSLKALVSDKKLSDGVVILGKYKTKEEIDKAFDSIHNEIKRVGFDVFYMSE